MPESRTPPGEPDTTINGRGYLKAATLVGAAAAARPGIAAAAEALPDASPPRPDVQLTSRAAEQEAPPPVTVTQLSCGSDFRVDVLCNLDIEYVAVIPGNTSRGLHEPVINYGMLSSPSLELISCMHAEMSVAIAHGYAKVAGKPTACMMHSTVGLQHAAMAFYNAYADRVPVFGTLGAIVDVREPHETNCCGQCSRPSRRSAIHQAILPKASASSSSMAATNAMARPVRGAGRPDRCSRRIPCRCSAEGEIANAFRAHARLYAGNVSRRSVADIIACLPNIPPGKPAHEIPLLNR